MQQKSLQPMIAMTQLKQKQPKQLVQDITDNDLKIQKQALAPETQPPPIPPSSSPSSTSYRPDIDGLRTIAVGIVVIFHAWPKLYTGGFIGVDIFFVISGYLITQILVKENLRGSFSYFGFYNRRVKRIYPALIVVLVFVLWVGFRYSDEQNFKMLTRTMAASTVFGANIEILTYKEGYFDASVKTNPLLHLWSLGVQQQFYIFWPFLISVILTRFSSRSFLILLTYTVLSFILNIIAVYISAKFDFYFPFCRFWQMAIGGLLAFKAIKLSNQLFIHALSAIGLITIIIASFLLSETNLYPGWWALFPTLASAAIIQSGSDSIVNKHILSNRGMVFFGKISYSLYLWHWPLLVFSRILFPEGSESILAQTWFVVLISVVMSLLSYFLVENPIRFKKQKVIFVVLLMIMLLIGIGSILMHVNSSKIKQEDSDGQDQQIPQPDNSKVPNSAQLERKKYAEEMIPTQQDYYVKNGKKIPNFSKNKNRQPLTPKKLTISSKSEHWFQQIFDKKIDQTSKYHRQKLPNSTTNFQVSNQGQPRLVLLVGDSHAHYTAFRLAKVFEDARRENRTHLLPTFVSIIFSGTTLIVYEECYRFVTEFIEEFRPEKILFVYCWVYYSVNHGFEVWDRYKDKANYEDKFFYENVGYFIQVVKNCTKMGINVTTNTFQPYSTLYSPGNMHDITGIIPKNTQPQPLSTFTKTYQHLANFLQSSVKEAGGNVINFTDHLCWEGMCEVVGPTGYCIFFDTNHWNYQAARNWLTLVDFLVVGEAGKEE